MAIPQAHTIYRYLIHSKIRLSVIIAVELPPQVLLLRASRPRTPMLKMFLATVLL